MNHVEKQVHDLTQRISALESEVAKLKAPKAVAAEEPAAADEKPADESPAA